MKTTLVLHVRHWSGSLVYLLILIHAYGFINVFLYPPQDLWKHTPPDHPDSITLQEALRLTSSFLSGVNERSQCKRAVMLSRGEVLPHLTLHVSRVHAHLIQNVTFFIICTCACPQRRQLLRDGFVVDVCESGHNLRHLFLYADMLLCAKLTSAGWAPLITAHWKHHNNIII